MYEVFEELLKEKGVTATDVSRATGIPRSSFTDWKKGRATPKAAKLQLIANFFDVPIETFTSKRKPVVFTVKHPRIRFVNSEYVDKVYKLIATEATNLAAEILKKELPKRIDAAIDSLLDDFEWELLACYRAADPGTRAAVRKLLDIQEEDTIPYPDQEVNETMPIAAHADDDATLEELEADVNILKNHVGVDVSGTDTVRRTD